MQTVTFYSYKGGTGRTLLAANIAMLAAQLGQRVVVLDFDLEAPGMAYKLLPDQAIVTSGLVGWLGDGLAAGEAPADLAAYLIDIPVVEEMVPGGRLVLMPAGRAPSPNYFQDLKRLRLEQRLEDGSAVDAVLELQRQIAEDLGADLLIVDARTGITSTNALTTHVLADQVVALTLDMPEQIDGTRAVLRQLQPLQSARTGEPIRLNVVLSRVPARPHDARSYLNTEIEQQTVRRVCDRLSEPATPLSRTLAIDHLHQLHTDPTLSHSEFLHLSQPGPWTRSVLHVDYYRLSIAVLGSMITGPAEDVLAHARDNGDSARTEELANFFVEPDVADEAASGRRSEQSAAVSLIQLLETVAELRSIVTTEPGRAPELGVALDDLRVELTAIGRIDAALAAAHENVSVYRRLANENASTYRPRLAASLHIVGTLSSMSGRGDEAFAALRETQMIYETLSEDDPSEYLPMLAIVLQHLATQLSALGHRHEEALSPTREAARIQREFVKVNPEEHLPRLAALLRLEGVLLSQAGWPGRALEPIREAIGVQRQLAETSPDTQLFLLAKSLELSGIVLWQDERFGEALIATSETVDIYRDLAEGSPNAYLAGLADSLDILSGRLSEAGDHHGAEDARLEAEAIRRRLLSGI